MTWEGIAEVYSATSATTINPAINNPAIERGSQ